jgi:TatA/E family protein of Tat protein translocase
MLAGPDLLVILGIALLVFGPKKLPEIAKTIGKAMGELKKTTDDIKESIGIEELKEIRGNLTGLDLYTNLAEKISSSMGAKGVTERSSIKADDAVHEGTPPVHDAATPLEETGKREKKRTEKSAGPKEGLAG